MTSMDEERLFVSPDTTSMISERGRKEAARSWIPTGSHRRRRLALQEQVSEQPPNVQPSGSSELQLAAETTSGELDYEPPAIDAVVWKFMSVKPATKPDKASRREVRSHVTRYQHRRHRDRDRTRKGDTALSSTSRPSNQDLSLSTSQPESSSSTLETFSDSTQTTPLSPVFPDPPHPNVLDDPADKFDVYARHLGMNGPTIWAHYLWQERQHGHLFHAQYQRFRGWAPKYLHPLILHDEAIVASTVLFTGCLLRQRAEKTVFSPAILQLQSNAYSLVQLAIDHPATQVSDATILAVLKMALFEAVFGHREAYQTHMCGLIRMISLRNGLSRLGMDGYLAHLLVWFDANLSTVTKSSRYLTHLISKEDIEAASADDDSFALGVGPSDEPSDEEPGKGDVLK